MKTFHFFLTFGLVIVLTISAAPARHASAQGRVAASAVFVPAQVSELGFVAPGLVKEVLFKEGDQVKAGDVLIVLDAPELQYAVTAADAALRSAQGNAELQKYARVKDIRKGKVFWDELPGELVALANVKVMQAQAALEVAQATLAQNTLIAPHDGTIASISVGPGEFVQLDQVVLTLATLDHFQIETTDLSERDIINVGMGDPANISFEALNENISGTVIRISPIADIVGGDVIYKVTIELDEQPKGLLWGMTAEVSIGE
jgi:membrane fusion protein, multidrug efflux system